MPKKPGLTPEQHAETGLLLNDAFVLAEKAAINIGAIYGETLRTRAKKVLQLLDTIREDLMRKAVKEGVEQARVSDSYMPQDRRKTGGQP